MFQNWEKSSSLHALQKALLKESAFFLLDQMSTSPKALLASLICKWTNRSVLLITEGVHIDQMYNDLTFFNAHLPIEFPAWETLPSEEIAPSKDILGKRMEALYQISQKKTPSVVLCPLHALLQKLSDKKKYHFQKLVKGEEIEFDTLIQTLSQMGYTREPIVFDKGQFAVRGGIIDLFPISSSDPYRIEFFGNTIDSIRIFDPTGQKSIQKVESFLLTPADELILLQQSLQFSTIADFLQDPIFLWEDLLSIEDVYVSLKQMPGFHTPLFHQLDYFFSKYPSHIFCSSQKIEDLSSVKYLAKETHFQHISFEVLDTSFEAKRFFHCFQKFTHLEQLEEKGPLICLYQTLSQEKEMRQKLHDFTNASFEKGQLSHGFSLLDLPLTYITSGDLTGKTLIRRQKWRSSHHTPASEFHALNVGDLVVHYHSGIGKYLGIEKQKNHKGEETEFLILEYSNNSKLFVPLSQSYLVSRYIGTKEETPLLSQLGTKKWQKIRENAQTQIVGYANDLLQRQAERIVEGGFVYPPDSDLMMQFEQDFPFVETDDQLLAIDAIKKDMMSNKPMDRLICGDVGYGKTEVAMRAAFKAVVDGGKQVALLVPTTVLATQHFETFQSRMGAFPVTMDVLSRSRSAKELKEILQKTKEGNLDILIGTHRLLSKDIHFKNLGLIIIDEEQRFGVRSKEHLKKFKAGVDCLTLSATPIPRTLHMSLISAKDMSVINTPPQDRLPIKTIIAENDPELAQNALLREFARGGQAYYIHNRVETIYERAASIQKIVPQARIAVVHGQMDPEDTSEIFHQFKQGEIDLLFATTIIENGIDIPNANTILIDRADTYGLADLYQLRGRVGRWNRASYTYFLIPKHQRITPQAQKRLSALAENSGFGGGMKIAMRDLEIRGAGDILGVQQSGQISSIGFHLYCKLLKRAVESLKRKKPISFFETKMEFSFPAYFPESYISDVSIRMELYYRLGELQQEKDLDDLLEELRDRFGPPPEPVMWLYHLTKLRLFAMQHQFTSLKFQNLSLLTERQKGKNLEKNSILLPQKMQKIPEIEFFVIEQLKKILSNVKGI